MRASQYRELESGTELFSAVELDRWGDVPPWLLGFGPAAGDAPAWTLYRFSSSNAAVNVRRSPTRQRPGHLYLYFWLMSNVGPAKANELLKLIGPLERFYGEYFAARPDLDFHRT